MTEANAILHELACNLSARNEALNHLSALRERIRSLDNAREELLARIAEPIPAPPIKQLTLVAKLDPKSAPCQQCRVRMSIGPFSNRWAKQAFSESTDAKGRTIYFCESCTKDLFEK